MINVEDVIEQTLIPLITRVTEVFRSAGVSGRLLCDLYARGFRGAIIQGALSARWPRAMALTVPAAGRAACAP